MPNAMPMKPPHLPGRPGALSVGLPSAAILTPWALLVVGLLVLYAPTVFDFSQGLWRGDRNSQGPIVLALSAWYFYFQAKRLMEQGEDIRRRPAPVRGWIVLVFGLLLYVLGRSQAVPLLELGSLIPVLLGFVLINFGARIAGRFWFAFFLLIFSVPLPASIVDALTQPMKIAASVSAEQLLHMMGFPVARSGVIISIGSYQLLVADACAGLNSLFTLEALGLLYMNVVRHESVFRNIALAVFIVPISFSSNVIRIMSLALLTYYYGDEVGQGFMHEFSGMLLFLTALFLIIFADTLLRAVSSRIRPARA